jgi:hypothetical protein
MTASEFLLFVLEAAVPIKLMRLQKAAPVM